MPDIAIEKMAPQNDLVYRATVSVVPPVTLPDFSKISVTVKPVTIADTEVDTVVADVRKMHAELKDSEGAAGEHDQVTVDMDLLDGLVPLEGGQARNHVVPLDEPYYIPGFAEKLIGAKAGDELNFELPFPADHYQKLYAGKNITFKVKVTKAQTRTLPEIDEEFAKKFGMTSIEELRKNIAENLAEEQRRKAEEAADIEMLQAVIAKTNFGDLPESIVDAERRRMMQDLMRSLKQHGITVEQYLGDMKKSPEELEAGFTDQAIERAKMGLVTHTVAVAEKIDATKEELEEELNAIRASYKNNTDAIARLLEPETQEAVLNSLRNRKVMEWMREKMVKAA
ncbi:MAG: trigger factor [Candidatus Magasanikbacteria bacterium]|nr:trigger factor [Candidatus Magasanikbacteria bacterium]